MTVILVLATFLVFIAVDTILSRRKARQASAEHIDVIAELQKTAPVSAAATDFVDGFRVPETIRYHSGHGWVMRERRNVLRVGVDEFAGKLAGRIEKIELPKAGHWVRQGQKAIAVLRNGQRADLVSPVEGEVVEVNSEIIDDPSLLRSDPYGRGWVMTVFCPDEETTLRNLLPANLVRGWMRETVARFYNSQPALAGSVAADGGLPVDDLCAALPESDWKRITDEFFLQ
jgi:glycine cleavage system H lipoate-binding protein